MRKQTIGEVAGLVGVDVETLRYYERIGLMSSPPRTKGGHRVYQDADLQRLRFIRRARDLGFSIEDIRSLLELMCPDRRNCRDVRDIAVVQLEKVQSKLRNLERMERILSEATSACTGDDAKVCSVLDLLSGESLALSASQIATLRGYHAKTRLSPGLDRFKSGAPGRTRTSTPCGT